MRTGTHLSVGAADAGDGGTGQDGLDGEERASREVGVEVGDADAARDCLFLEHGNSERNVLVYCWLVKCSVRIVDLLICADAGEVKVAFLEVERSRDLGAALLDLLPVAADHLVEEDLEAVVGVHG